MKLPFTILITFFIQFSKMMVDSLIDVLVFTVPQPLPHIIPGSEIGVDHHLRHINEHLSQEEDAALPYNAEASQQNIVR